MQLVLGITYFLFFCWLITKLKLFSSSSIRPVVYQSVLGVKFLIGLVSLFIHQFYITGGDDVSYFKDGLFIAKQATQNWEVFWQSMTKNGGYSDAVLPVLDETKKWFVGDNFGMKSTHRFIIRFHAISSFLSFGSIYIHILFVSFISILGLRLAEKLVYLAGMKNEMLNLIFIQLFPSILFWSSSLLKESFVITTVVCYTYSIYLLNNNLDKYRYWIWVGVFGTVIIYIKSYVFLAILPSTIYMLFKRAQNQKNEWVLALGVQTMLTLILFNLNNVSSSFNFFGFWQQKQEAFIQLKEITNPGSGFDISPLHSVSDIFKNIPAALLNVFAQYQLFPFKRIIYVLPILENILVFGLLFYSFNKTKPSWNKKQITLFFFSLLFVINTSIIIGETVPVQGAISRYKSVIMPYVVIILLFCNQNTFYRKQWFKKYQNYLYK